MPASPSALLLKRPRFDVPVRTVPNVKLINAADTALAVISGEVLPAEEVASAIRKSLASADAKLVDGFYTARGRVEL